MNLAGGAMLDIGVYALSVVRSFMDKKPEEVVSQRKVSPTGSDEQATILLKNDSDQMATVALSMHSKQPKRAMISCEKVFLQLSGIYKKHSWLQVKEIVRIRTLT